MKGLTDVDSTMAWVLANGEQSVNAHGSASLELTDHMWGGGGGCGGKGGKPPGNIGG